MRIAGEFFTDGVARDSENSVNNMDVSIGRDNVGMNHSGVDAVAVNRQCADALSAHDVEMQLLVKSVCVRSSLLEKNNTFPKF